MRNWFAVIGFVLVALIVGVCTACSDDDDQADAWAPATADNRDDNRRVDFGVWTPSSGPRSTSRMDAGSGKVLARRSATGWSGEVGTFGRHTAMPGSSQMATPATSAFSTSATTHRASGLTISGWGREETTTGTASARAELNRPSTSRFLQGITRSKHTASVDTNSARPTPPAAAAGESAASVRPHAMPNSVRVSDNKDRNENGDCRHAGDNCSDDDQMTVLVCVQPDSCRFG